MVGVGLGKIVASKMGGRVPSGNGVRVGRRVGVGLVATAVVVWLLLACVGLLFGLALFFIAPAISLQYARTNDFSACLRFGEVIGIARDNIGDITIVALVLIVANFVLQAVIGSLAATGCGLIIAIPLAWVVFPWLAMSGGHMYGQIAAKIEGKGMAF